MKTLYLCGPMSGLPNHNHTAFNAAARQLRAAGYFVFNPTENGLPAESAWEDHMAADLCALFDSIEMYSQIGLATISDTSQSQGARLELAIARRLRIPAKTAEQWINETTGATC